MSLELTSLPSDNLYKFCALLGLSLTVFNIYYSLEMQSLSEVKTIEYLGEKENLKFKKSYFATGKESSIIKVKKFQCYWKNEDPETKK